MVMELHTHVYTGETSTEDGHRHYYIGRTSASPDVPGHKHHMSGQTNLSYSPIHQYSFITEPGTSSGMGIAIITKA